jgi:hypothetical protein
MRRNIAQALRPSNPALCAQDPSAGDCPVLARRPHPNFVTYIDSDWSGNSSYHSANFKLERRTSSMIFTTIYTWAKSIDSKSAAAGIGNDVAGWQGFLDNHDVRRDRGRSQFNVDHRLVTSFVYQLPVGRGQRYLSNVSPVVEHILGGWQVNGILTFQDGFPMTVQDADAGGLNDSSGTNRPHLVGEPEPDGFNRTIDKWFNTDAFAQPAPAVLGNSGRSIMSSPGINNWDLGLFKNFQITERVGFQLRLESFNAWNHAQWSTPNRNRADARFGRILGTRDARINQIGAKIVW